MLPKTQALLLCTFWIHSGSEQDVGETPVMLSYGDAAATALTWKRILASRKDTSRRGAAVCAQVQQMRQSIESIPDGLHGSRQPVKVDINTMSANA